MELFETVILNNWFFGFVAKKLGASSHKEHKNKNRNADLIDNMYM